MIEIKQIGDFIQTIIEEKKSTPQDTPQDTIRADKHIKALLKMFLGDLKRDEIQAKLGLSDREHFRKEYLKPALEQGFIEMTMPDKPTSKNQRYRLSKKGKALKQQLE